MNINFSLDDELKNAIEYEAKRYRISVTALIRMTLVDKFLKPQTTVQRPQVPQRIKIKETPPTPALDPYEVWCKKIEDACDLNVDRTAARHFFTSGRSAQSMIDGIKSGE